MRELLKGALGDDGSYGVLLADGELQIKAGYKLEAILAPLKSKVIDKIKAAIPGDLDDQLLDKLWAELLKAIAE